MKKLLKKSCFWIGAVLLAGAIVLAVVSSAMNPKVAVLDQMEKGINKGDNSALLKCFSPETQKTLSALEIGLLNMNFSEFLTGGKKVNVIYENVSDAEEGEAKVYAFMLFNENGTCKELSTSTEELEKSGNKYYLSY